MPARIDPQIPLRGFYFFTSWLRRGGKGIRTPDLLIANETLYQLSYTPNTFHSNPYGRTLKLPTAGRLKHLIWVGAIVPIARITASTRAVRDNGPYQVLNAKLFPISQRSLRLCGKKLKAALKHSLPLSAVELKIHWKIQIGRFGNSSLPAQPTCSLYPFLTRPDPVELRSRSHSPSRTIPPVPFHQLNQNRPLTPYRDWETDRKSVV